MASYNFEVNNTFRKRWRDVRWALDIPSVLNFQNAYEWQYDNSFSFWKEDTEWLKA